jgi:hypothetical protein
VATPYLSAIIPAKTPCATPRLDKRANPSHFSENSCNLNSPNTLRRPNCDRLFTHSKKTQNHSVQCSPCLAPRAEAPSAIHHAIVLFLAPWHISQMTNCLFPSMFHLGRYSRRNTRIRGYCLLPSWPLCTLWFRPVGSKNMKNVNLLSFASRINLQRSSCAQLERTPLLPTLTHQQLTIITRETFSKLERLPSPFRTPHSALRTFSRCPSSAAPNCSSTLPNPSSNVPNPSRNAQLEPFASRPNFTSLSRPTPYESAPEKTTSDLSPLPQPAPTFDPEPRTPNPWTT